MKLGRRLWDVPWTRKLYEQDNDESEDEEEEEDDGKDQSKMVKDILKIANSMKSGPKRGEHL